MILLLSFNFIAAQNMLRTCEVNLRRGKQITQNSSNNPFLLPFNISSKEYRSYIHCRVGLQKQLGQWDSHYTVSSDNWVIRFHNLWRFPSVFTDLMLLEGDLLAECLATGGAGEGCRGPVLQPLMLPQLRGQAEAVGTRGAVKPKWIQC